MKYASLAVVFATFLTWVVTFPARGQVAAGQLVGAWVRTSDADMKGLDFTKEGKVMVYFGGGGEGTTFDYAVLGDGRLDITELGIEHHFYLPALSGDQLQLKDAQSGKVWRYRRLKSGETMVAALTAADQALNRAIQTRNAAVPAFLARQDLVLVATEALNSGPPQQGIVGEDLRPKIPTPAALQFTPNSTEYGGRAIFDVKPPRLDAVGAQIQNPQVDTPTVAIWFGPGNAAQNRGTLLFHPSGTAPNIVLTYSIVTGGPPALIIKADSALRAQILDHVKAEVTRLNSLKTPVLTMLKDYVVLKGMSGSTLPSERKGFSDEFVLSRQNNNWIGQLRLTNLTTGAVEVSPAMGAVGIVNEKPALQVLTQKRRYEFTAIDTAGGKLTGLWQMPNNPQGRPAELTVSEALDAKGRDSLFAARKAALTKLSSGTVYRGMLSDTFGGMAQPPSPITVTLASGANGAITGTAEYLAQGCTMTLSGKVTDTPFGPQVQLRYMSGQANSNTWNGAANFVNAVQHEVWALGVSSNGSGPAIGLEGFAVPNPGPTATSVTLQLTPFSDKDKAAITAALSSGARFKVTNPQGPGPDDILTCSVDASGKPTFTLASGGTHLNNYPGTNFSGELTEAGGWYQMTAPMVRPRFSTKDYEYKIFLTLIDGQVYLNGLAYSVRQGPASWGPQGRFDAAQVKPTN